MEMAYVNVAEWSPEHVAEWLRGLEYSLVPYVQFFLNNEITGCHLLNLTADDLEDLHIFKIGHQLLILEAVELLRQLHYSLNSETLQSLAVKLACKARSLYNDLKLNGPPEHGESTRQERVSTGVLSAVSEVLTSIKALVLWLDRLPFQHDPLCVKLKKAVLKLSIELASTTQRDQFAERPHSLIKRNSLQIAELCDAFVQDSKDSLILQPASLDIAMIKKKPDEELGIHIKSTYSGVHIIGGIKDQSPAKLCNKVEKGDEIVQVNYQTVIGWQQKKLVTVMTEHSTELHLTLKKRPRHINILGEVIILRPYRIPSKKTANKRNNWSDDKVGSPDNCSTSNESECLRDEYNEDDDDSAFLPASVNHLLLNQDLSIQHRLFSTPTSVTIQRRATVSGASPTILKPPVSIEDLVNGVPCVKSNDNFIRSVSHDPSSQNLCLKLKTDFNHSSESNSEDSIQNGAIENDHIDIDTDALSVQDLTNKEKFPVHPLPDLPVHEEDYTVLENKSLDKNGDCIVLPKKSACRDSLKQVECETDTKSSYNNEDSLKPFAQARQNNIILYNWEGADTEFCGRRPSAHDISNEIAGSSVTPVLLRSASTIETPPMDLGYATDKEPGDVGSYQVVIVAGVPQKCVSSVKDKEKNKGMELKSHPYKMKRSIVGKFGSRHISCKDLGKGDCEGWLYKQKERKGFFPSGHHWVKRWIVLKDHLLYSYRDDNDTRAESLISLPGSTVSPMTDCKSKKYAFKVCHQQVTIYFATESQKDLAHWMNKMGLAAIAYDASADFTTSSFSKPGVILGLANNFYSETEDSENGSPTFVRRSCDNELLSGSPEYLSKYGFNSQRKTKTLSISNSRIASSMFPKIKKRYSNKDVCFNGTKNDEINDEHSIFLNTSAMEEFSNSGERYYAFKDSKISYNRSFSCTEASRSMKSYVRKTNSDKTGIPHQTDRYSNNSTVDEEYDILTSSLGRQQRPLAKEITPGLVARMAVSYSNLSHKNAIHSSNVTKNFSLQKGIPAPGYVAKISDSFDHLAKTGKSSTTIDRYKRIHVISPKSQPYKYKRSASESQMGKTNSFYSPNGGSSSSNPQSSCSLLEDERQPKTERYISLLDKEYNKVFEGKKVSQHQLKSPSLNDSNHTRRMRFFPTNNFIESTCSLVDVQSKKNVVERSGSKGYNTATESNPSLCGEISTKNPSSSSSQVSDVLTSSEGIQNIGFCCIDQTSEENIDYNTLPLFSKEKGLDNNHLAITDSDGSYMTSHQNRNMTLLDSELNDVPKASFKFFNSPKFMKKLTSPKLDKKNIFKSKKQAKELKRAEQKETSQTERKFFGSPILAKALFRSPRTEKKVITVSSGVQTDNMSEDIVHSSKPLHDLNRNESVSVLGLSLNPNLVYHEADVATSKSSSSCSSLNSVASNNPLTNSGFTETKVKPQITVSLPLTVEKNADCRISPSDASRMPLKPMMGISMLSKKRLPSVSGDSSISVSSSKSSQDGNTKESTIFHSEASLEINEEEINHAHEHLHLVNFPNSDTGPISEASENSGNDS